MQSTPWRDRQQHSLFDADAPPTPPERPPEVCQWPGCRWRPRATVTAIPSRTRADGAAPTRRAWLCAWHSGRFDQDGAVTAA